MLGWLKRVAGGAVGIFNIVRPSPSRFAHKFWSLCARAAQLGMYGELPDEERKPSARPLQIYAMLVN